MSEIKEGEVIVNINDLKNIIGETIKDMSLPQIEALKVEIEKTNRAAIFPSGDDNVWESGKTIVDTSFFSKEFPRSRFRDIHTDGNSMGRTLRAAGGPFLSLSPAMEKFAIVIKSRGNPTTMKQYGVDILEYNTEVQTSNTKFVGPMTTTDAGALVPVEYLATIIEFAVAQSQILPKVWRLPMGSLTLKIPKLAQTAGSYFGGITLYHPGEGGLKTDTKVDLDDLTFTAGKLIGLILLTDELIMDSAINLINYITGLFVRAFQYKIEAEIIDGTGANAQMLGILNDPAINWVARQTAGTVKRDDVINLESALDENFSNLTYLSRRLTINTLRQEKVSNMPIYLEGFQTSLGATMVPQLLGYPIVKTRNVPAIGNKGDIILGDLGFYIWALRQDMTIDTSREYRFAYDETAVRFVMRMDGKPGVSIAFAALDSSIS